MVGPGDEIEAGAGGRSHLRASHTDREQVIDRLKAAFVHGRLAKDEFDLRVGQVLASRTYADLAALTADIAAGPTRAQPLEPARKSENVPASKTIARMTAAGASVSMVFIGAELIADGGNPVVGLVVVSLTGFLVAVLIAGFLTFLSRVFEKSSSRQPPQGLPPSASGEVAQRMASADSADSNRDSNSSRQRRAETSGDRPQHSHDSCQLGICPA
jgi:hypothetical protein